MDTIKLLLSPTNRSNLTKLIPNSGDLETAAKYFSWVKEVRFTKSENEVLKSFESVRNKEERDKVINDWFHTKTEIEISKEFFDFIVKEIKTRNESHCIQIDDDLELYKYLLEVNNGIKE